MPDRQFGGLRANCAELDNESVYPLRAHRRESRIMWGIGWN